MEDQLTSFLEFLATERNYSDNTTAAYRNDLSQFLAWLRERYPLVNRWSAVSAEHVGAYVKALEKRSYTASSIARKVAAIKSFFHYLLARGHISDDPTDGLDSPKVKKRLPNTLPAEDIRLLLEAPTKKRTAKNLRDAALLNVLYATGMRVTEAVSLRVEDVDLADSVLLCLGKDESARILPFEEDTRIVLADYLENGRPHLVKDRDVDALFLNHRGQQLTRQGLWLIIKAYADEAGLSDNVTPHTLRHSFAAHRLSSGAELREVQHLLGHANISTTLVYSQMPESKEADA
jgi:integrase/recombinase XerD